MGKSPLSDGIDGISAVYYAEADSVGISESPALDAIEFLTVAPSQVHPESCCVLIVFGVELPMPFVRVTSIFFHIRE